MRWTLISAVVLEVLDELLGVMAEITKVDRTPT
jgi:hypothetical protein